MADGKKSFLFYTNWLSTFENLTDEEAGKLIKHLLRYVNDLNPDAPDRLTQLVFEPLKQILKMDLKKYENITERNRANGSLGGRPKNPKKPKKPTGLFGNPKEPKKADIDIDIDIDNELPKGNNIIHADAKLSKREDEFKLSISPYVEKYGRDMCNDFYLYWTEPNKSKTKLRFEMQRTWDVARRLATWAKNNQKYKPISAQQKVSETIYREF